MRIGGGVRGLKVGGMRRQVRQRQLLQLLPIIACICLPNLRMHLPALRACKERDELTLLVNVRGHEGGSLVGAKGIGEG